MTDRRRRRGKGNPDWKKKYGFHHYGGRGGGYRMDRFLRKGLEVGGGRLGEGTRKVGGSVPRNRKNTNKKE